MGLQKYRADTRGPKQRNGATPYYTKWMGGPTLALVRECPIANRKGVDPRTVYVRGEPITYSAIPAACTYRGKKVTGYLATDENGEWVFRAHDSQLVEQR